MLAGSFAQGLMITQILVLDGPNPWIQLAEGICTSLTADEEGDGGEVLDGWIGGSQKLVEDSATTARRLATFLEGGTRGRTCNPWRRSEGESSVPF